MVFLKLIDATYIARHEKDLIKEEETWRMLQEIIRCPELFKAITGHNAKGAIDPQLDDLRDDEIKMKKLRHLELLERRGFEVEELKLKLYQSAREEKKAKADADEAEKHYIVGVDWQYPPKY